MSSLPTGSDRRANDGTPRWVKAFGIIIFIVIVLFVNLQLTGVAGDHGPGRHAASSGVLLAESITAITERRL